MHRTSGSTRVNLLQRTALGIALSLGVVVGGSAYAPAAMAAKQPKMKFSKGFTEVAAPLQKAIDDAKQRPDVISAKSDLDAANDALAQARTDADRAQATALATSAQAQLGANLQDERAKLEQAFAAIENEDDRFMAGSLAVGLGSLAQDHKLQRRGLMSMIDSGKAPPENIPQYNFFVGQLAYQDNDFPAARTALQAAMSGGYRENNIEALLAETYFASNQVPEGLATLNQLIDQKAQSGTPAPAAWYRRGLAASFKAGLINDAAVFGAKLARAYPNKDSWSSSITVVRELGKFGSQETLDLMRLMGRTNSYVEERDFIEYIQAADPRRLPGEVLDVINTGVSAGMLKANDTFIIDSRNQVTDRIASDRSSLASYERDARAANATEATVTGAADALLSYGEPAKAEELYKIALGKPGVDTQRVLTRLGIAQSDLGKYAEAMATFAKITGPRKPIADLWSSYSAVKQQPAAAVAPATTAAQ